MKKTERKKRRVYLQDFEKGADGHFEYTGASYAYEDENPVSRKAFVARLAVSLFAIAACAALKGSFKVPGMTGWGGTSPIVLIPYAISLVAMLLLLWAGVGLCMAGDPIREYKYERCVEPLRRRSVFFAAAEGLCAVGEIVYIILYGVGENLVGAILFFALCAIAGAAAVFAGREVSRAKWKFAPKKSRLVE